MYLLFKKLNLDKPRENFLPGYQQSPGKREITQSPSSSVCFRIYFLHSVENGGREDYDDLLNLMTYFSPLRKNP